MDPEFKSLIKRVKEYNSAADVKRLETAYNYAKKNYEGHMRKSGDSVIMHTLETSKILTTQKVDDDTLVAALLHELPNYTNIKSKEVGNKFGHKVGVLISAYEKMSSIKTAKEANELETLRKMCLVMAKDLRVVLIKLADRLHNLQTLESLPSDERKKIAKETLDIFVPIASRLGVYRLRSIIEDLCFKFLNETEYRNIQDQLKILGKKRKNSIDEITNAVKDFLAEKNVKARVAGRIKNSYSIYKKLKKKGKSSIDEIHDIFAIRIIIPTQENKEGEEMIAPLYELIGNFHNKWKPLPGRFKDYVGFPKPNGYRSLHTTVIGLAPHSFKEPVEIQIRTDKMHEEAEYGVASHWLYKEAKGNSGVHKAHVEWIKSLAQFSENMESENKDEVMNELKVDIFQDRIFAFTPKGDVRDLPAGSTPIDFAYSIHSDVGNKCVMAKINSNVVPLNYELQNGDVIEIITRNNSKPKLEWLSFIKTSSAKTKIKAFFNSFDQDQNFRQGKEILNNKLEQFGKPKLDLKLTILKNVGNKRLTFKEREEIIRQIGNGSFLPSTIIWKIYSYEDFISNKADNISEKSPTEPTEKNFDKHIIVGGEKGLPIKIAKCCKPAFGQPIIGYITRGRSTSIHKKDCKILKKSNSERMISSKWSGVPEEELKQVSLIVETIGDTLIMREITLAVNKCDGNILTFHIKNQKNNRILWDLIIEIEDFLQFEKILDEISNAPGVKFVKKKA